MPLYVEARANTLPEEQALGPWGVAPGPDFLPNAFDGSRACLILMIDFDGATNFSNRVRPRLRARNALPENGGSALAEFTRIALIEPGEVPHKLAAEAANGRGQTSHAIIPGFEWSFWSLFLNF
jgi:hypothetical protein